MPSPLLIQLVLRGSFTLKKVIVWERLKSRRLADSQTAALGRLRVDEIMAVLGNVRRDRGGGAVCHLHAKPVVEFCFLQSRRDVLVIREQCTWKIVEQRRTAMNQPES